MSIKRNYGIDLLRLVLMFMVCMLHVLGHGGVISSCPDGTPGFYVFWFMYTFANCAVDSFAIISGYIASDKPRTYDKIVNMWFQAFFYSFILGLVLSLIGVNPNWNFKGIIQTAFPVTFNVFWYFTAYFVLFFSIPLLNPFLFSIDEKTAKNTLVIIVALFSVIGFINDPFKTANGYSALWLMVLYCVGVLAKRIRLFESLSTSALIILVIACSAATWAMRVFTGSTILMRYTSPTVFLCGLILVILFSRLNPKGTLIAKLSPLAFGVYLFQVNPVIWDRIINDSFAFLGEKSFTVGFLGVFVFAFLIFFSGLLIDYLRRQLEKLFKIPQLSRTIAALIGKLLAKMTFFLK